MQKYPYIEENNLKEQQFQRFNKVSTTFFIALCFTFAHTQLNYHLTQKNRTTTVDTSVAQKPKILNPFFIDILEQTENFSESFYKDNEGIAIAYGWNISKNTQAFNNKITEILNFSENEKTLISQYSHKKTKEVPEELKSIVIKKEQSILMVNYMYNFYLQEFIDILEKKSNDTTVVDKFHTHFTAQDKAVFSHMAYKVGKNNLDKYNKFYEKLINMLNSNKFSTQDYHNLAQQISYTFKYKGKRKIDIKAQDVHRQQLARAN